MEVLPFSFGQFSKAVPEVCAIDTAAAGGNGWQPSNPTWGHCAVVALWAQNFYGGGLVRVDLVGTPFANQQSHYYNDTSSPLIGESAIDLTSGQFGGALNPLSLPYEHRPRAHVISGADTCKRYALFGVRLLEKLLPNQALMSDRFYCRCIHQALRSPCQKKGVGAILVHDEDAIIGRECNRPIKGLESLCQPSCIRFSIPSRIESMLGACGHAEERLLWGEVSGGLPQNSFAHSEIYVAGVTAQGLPEKRPFPEFTCLRCAVAMHYAGIAAVNVAHDGKRWVRQTTQEALASAKEYALGKKKI